MKTISGSVVAAVAASACCLGPVLLSAVGAGALGAAAVQLEPYRPVFVAMTAMLLGAAFYTTYRLQAETCTDGTCAAASRRVAKTLLWLATIVVILLVTFPYYVEFLV